LGFAAVAGLLAVGGCASRQGDATGSAPGPPSGVVSAPTPTASESARLPRISVQRSGGLAGAQDTVDVDPEGAWTATGRSGASSGGRLTAGQIATLRALSGDPRLAGEAGRTPRPSHCSDAFQYVLVTGTARTAYVDCPADGDQPVASMALVSQVLQFTLLKQG
jgi:hypothetical protein